MICLHMTTRRELLREERHQLLLMQVDVANTSTSAIAEDNHWLTNCLFVITADYFVDMRLIHLIPQFDYGFIFIHGFLFEEGCRRHPSIIASVSVKFANLLAETEIRDLFLLMQTAFWQFVAVANVTARVAAVVSVFFSEPTNLIVASTIHFVGVFADLPRPCLVALDVNSSVFSPVTLCDGDLLVPTLHVNLHSDRTGKARCSPCRFLQQCALSCLAPF